MYLLNYYYYFLIRELVYYVLIGNKQRNKNVDKFNICIGMCLD